MKRCLCLMAIVGCAAVSAGEEKPFWPGRLGGPGANGNPQGVPLSKSGIFQWHYPKDQQGQSDEVFVAAPVAATGDNVLVPLAGEEGRRGVACLSADVKQLDIPSPRWVYKTRNEVWSSAAACNNAVLLVDGRPGDADRFLHCIDIAEGKRRWRAVVAPKASGRFAVAPGRVFVQDAEGQLTSYDLEGKKLWSQPWPAMAVDPVVVAGMVIVAEEPSVLAGLDPATGQRRWRLSLPKAIAIAPAVWKDALYVGTKAELAAYDLAGGKTASLWSRPCDGVAGDIAVSDKWIALVNGKSELVLLKRGDGAEAARKPGALVVVAPMLDSSAVLYATADQICRLPLDKPDAEPSRWADLSWLGEPVTAMVYYRNCLYLGMKGWGLVRFGDAGR
ncbi:MAG: PQQ-binding-like beta-propeller repeat protein [Thermoguttaceae bacterium]|jgi:hypothetical protein